MGWLYVPGLEGSNSGSPSQCPDTAPSVMWRGKPTPPPYSRNAWRMVCSTRLRSTVTSDPSMVERGVSEWISSLPATRANRSPSPGASEEPTTPDTSGPTSPGSSESADQRTPSSKTSGDTFALGSPTCYGTLPNSGSMRSGVCSPRPYPEPPISAIASSVSLPTPTAMQYGRNRGGANRGRIPTPSATDWKGSARRGQRRGQLTDPAAGVIEIGGQLNPTWVEWLMGWPIGWTDLEPVGMAPFQRWRREHLRHCGSG